MTREQHIKLYKQRLEQLDRYYERVKSDYLKFIKELERNNE